MNTLTKLPALLLLLVASMFAQVQVHTERFTPPSKVSPAITATDLSVSAVVVGWYDTALPCIGCVSGASTGNVAVAYPLTSFYANTDYKWTLMANANAYTGPCIASMGIVQAGVIKYSLISPQSCSSGTTFIISSTMHIPVGVSGQALLVGQIKSVDGTVVSTLSVPVLVQ